MALATVPEIKKALVAAGFEVYRTRGTQVHIADRVRDNLIMDSGVSVEVGESLRVRFVVRAQRCDFPSDVPAVLFDRARALAAGALQRGFQEVSTLASPMKDPGDASRTLDTWYEVSFEKAVGDVPEILSEVRFALGVEKAARASPPGS